MLINRLIAGTFKADLIEQWEEVICGSIERNLCVLRYTDEIIFRFDVAHDLMTSFINCKRLRDYQVTTCCRLNF